MIKAKVCIVIAMLVSGLFASPGVASAADPLGLTLDDGAGETLGLGTDTIAVWVCKVPGTTNPKTFTAVEVAEWANETVAPFFSLMSRGRYSTVFEAAGSFSSSADRCLDDAISLTSDPRFTNAFVIDDTDQGGGLGGSGLWFIADGVVSPAAPAAPPALSGRGFIVRGGMYDFPATPTHEIGHTLAWPHSGSSVNPYDNAADLMSGHGVDNLCPVTETSLRGPCRVTHTLGFNRYTSGWVDPSEISLVTKPRAAVDLAGPESAGVQFAVVPSADPLVFTTVEARPAVGYDAESGIEGVVLHTVDQAASCASALCWGLSRVQAPAIGGPGSGDHILGVGESAVVHGVTISVDAATSAGYTVSFSGTPQGCAMGPNRFGDVSTASFAFNDIGCIRLLGITTGTSATTYSPTDSVTREQMAAFLARLARLAGHDCRNDPTPFVDIAGSFAEADVACIYALGVTTGVSSSRYDPDGLVTREQMAAFLGRLWRDGIGGTCGTEDPPFVDIAGSFADTDIACIYGLDITKGTSASTYSPREAVTREQMASFLARFWKTA